MYFDSLISAVDCDIENGLEAKIRFSFEVPIRYCFLDPVEDLEVWGDCGRLSRWKFWTSCSSPGLFEDEHRRVFIGFLSNFFSLSAVLDWDHAHDLIGRGYFPERMKSRFKRERQNYFDLFLCFKGWLFLLLKYY